MKRILFANFLALSLLLGGTTYAKSDIWKSFNGKYAPSEMEMIQQPNDYKIFQLNNAEMKAYLEDVSYDYNNAKLIEIPTPEGGFKTFKVWRNNTMHPELAAKFSEIMTFTIEELGNPIVTGKLGFNLFGFNAFVHDGAKTYFIDPYSNANDGYYMAFYKKDIKQDPFYCGTPDELKRTGIADIDEMVNTPSVPLSSNPNEPTLPPYSHGFKQRKFRTAITCTGEFAVLIVGQRNPTKAQVLSKIVDIINRINSYYEREIAVTLELIPNNELIIFTDNTLDPFNYPVTLDRLIDESQSAVHDRIGANNYDLGHIFCTASGGLAATPAVCNQNSKARAGSGIGNTTNVYVPMHEMGHQMNASHTFSANTGTCQGNGMPEGAYESGSGVTIMSYSGCTGSDVPKNIDEYFHVNTLLEISNHINSVSCGELLNNIPVLSIPNNTEKYNIPKNTPFELVGKAASVQGSQIPQTFLYNWEQYDRKFDLVEPDMSDETEGPSLKSHYPNTSTSQSYPPTSEIIAGNYSLPGYRLPNVARELNFKYTARGLLNGRGAFCTIDSTVKLNVISSAGPFRVTSHTSSSTWNPGDVVTITWNVANTNLAPINCNGVTIYLHFPDGSQPDRLLVSYAPNSGTASYTVQDFFAKDGYIKVKGSGNVFFDIGKGKINVTGTNIDEQTFNNKIEVFPNPATDKITITSHLKYSELKVFMYNMSGNVIWSGTMKEKLELPTSDYASGNYIIQLVDEATGYRANKKVTIQ